MVIGSKGVVSEDQVYKSFDHRFAVFAINSIDEYVSEWKGFSNLLAMCFVGLLVVFRHQRDGLAFCFTVFETSKIRGFDFLFKEQFALCRRTVSGDLEEKLSIHLSEQANLFRPLGTVEECTPVLELVLEAPLVGLSFLLEVSFPLFWRFRCSNLL